jgi:hypothetical protein
MRWLTYRFFGYAAVNFILFIFMGPARTSSAATSPVVLGFSGHWMAFYSAAVAIFYSARHAEEHDRGRRCRLDIRLGRSQGTAKIATGKFCLPWAPDEQPTSRLWTPLARLAR